MPQPYLKPRYEIDFVRGNYGGFRDDNFLVNWTTNGVTATTDGDVVTLTFTAIPGLYVKSGVPALSTSAYGFLSCRAIAGYVGSGNNFVIHVVYNDSTEDDLTFATNAPPLPAQNGFVVQTFALTAGKTMSGFSIAIQGTNKIDWIAISKQSTIISQTQDVDPINGTRSTQAADDISFNLRNTNGYYTTSPNPLNLNDVMYVYLGYVQDDTIPDNRKMNKIFGGTIEELTPNLSKSSDLLTVHGIGWAQELLRVYSTKEYGSQSINSSIDTMTGTITDIISVVNAGGYQLTTNYIQTFT